MGGLLIPLSCHLQFTHTADELAAKLAELEQTCESAFERAAEWLKDAAPLKQYV